VDKKVDMSIQDLSGVDFLDTDKVRLIYAGLKELSGGDRAIHVLKRTLYNYLTGQFLGWSSERERNIIAFAELIDEDPTHGDYAIYLSSYVKAFSAAVRAIGGWEAGRKTCLYSGSDTGKAAEFVSQVNAGSGAAREIVRGHVASLFDRGLAQKYYSAAFGQSHIVKRFYIDQGINTYFASLESQPRLAEDPQHKISHICSSAKLSLVFSMDAGFCSAYLPLMLHYARHMSDINYHFVFVGSEKEISACREMLDVLVAAQEKCGGMKMVNYSYSTMSIPATVKEKVTFYACARYFAASELLEHFEGVYVMDVDIQFTENPAIYFSSMWKHDVCLPKGLNLGQLMPWRRFMAGNVFVRNTTVGRAFLNMVVDYMRAGLVCPDSWTLDQNALCYAMEVMNMEVYDLNSRGKPTSQPRINKLFESGISRWWVEGAASTGRLGRYLDRLRRFVH
jgi:hypothetical protein